MTRHEVVLGAGTAGTMTLVVRATDSAGGTNRTTVKLALQ